MTKLNKYIKRMTYIGLFVLLSIIAVIFIVSQKSIQTINNCDTSCLQDYVVCISNFDDCKTNCWKDYNEYVKDNTVMCRELDGLEKCRDISDSTTKRVMALDSKKCEDNCNSNLNVCEKEHKKCAEEIRDCISKK